MADESITQNEDGYELLAGLVFILGTPLGLLLYEKGGETEHFRPSGRKGLRARVYGEGDESPGTLGLRRDRLQEKILKVF